MKKATIVASVIVGISFSIGFLSGRLAPGSAARDHDDAWFSHEEKLYEDLKTLLHVARGSLVRGDNFEVMIDGSEIYGAKFTNPTSPGDPPEQVLYYLTSDPKPKFLGLTGWLTLRKIDATHVDVVFRPGFLQLRPSAMAIYVDGHNIGAVEWESAERDQQTAEPQKTGPPAPADR
jgi:hypothetical protein